MAVDEQAWHEAWDALGEVVGAEAAATLMGAWPRDVARRSDIELLDSKIEGVEVRLDAKIEALQGFLVERIQRSEEHLVAVMRGELNTQGRSLMFGFVGLQGVIGTFVVALLRFSV